MDAQHLNIDTIKENRNFKGITQEDTKELIDTLYAFSILSYEAYTKIGGDFDFVVHIQGDEPFIQPSQLETVKA